MDKKDNKLNIYYIGYSHLFIYKLLIYYIFITIINKIGVTDKKFNIFKSYYIENMYKSLITDFFLIYTYLKISESMPSKIPILYRRIVSIIFLNVLLNFYINYSTHNKGLIELLRQWSKSMGWYAIIWDLIHINIVGLGADKINSLEIFQNEKIHLLIFPIIGLFLMHQ